MQQMVPVFMAGPQGSQVAQVSMQNCNAACLQQHSKMCYTLVLVQAERDQLPHPGMLPQQHLQEIQIPPPPTAPPPGWVGQLEQHEASMPQGMPVYGHSQQRQMQVPQTLPSSGNGLEVEVRHSEEETMHGWRYGGRLPERSWADMSEEGQPHGPVLMDRPPMRGQLLATSPMGTRSAIEDRSALKDPALCPGSAQMRMPGKTMGNSMFGGTHVDRQQGKVDCLFNQGSPSADLIEYGLLTNMKTQLQALLDEDPSTVIIARRINKLGFSSAEYLRTHFRSYGDVKNVYVSHSRVKVNLPKKLRGERRSSDTRQKLRPATLAFVVMASAEATARILADGPEHSINGITVLMQAFQRKDRVESAASQTDEINAVADAGAVEIDVVDRPGWPSPYSETEGDNDQPPQTLLDGPLPLTAESAAFDGATE